MTPSSSATRCIVTATSPSASAIRIPAHAIVSRLNVGFGPRLGVDVFPHSTAIACVPSAIGAPPCRRKTVSMILCIRWTQFLMGVRRPDATDRSARLISGAGVAGPALAYWLPRYGADTTVVEIAPALRTSASRSTSAARPTSACWKRWG